jgi:hypothetical protein
MDFLLFLPLCPLRFSTFGALNGACAAYWGMAALLCLPRQDSQVGKMTVLGDWHVLVVMLFWCVAFQCFDDSRIKISNKCRYMFAVCDDFASAMPCAAAGPSRSRHVHGSMTGLERFTICLCTVSC